MCFFKCKFQCPTAVWRKRSSQCYSITRLLLDMTFQDSSFSNNLTYKFSETLSQNDTVDSTMYYATCVGKMY